MTPKQTAIATAVACVIAAGQTQANGTDPTVVAGQASFSASGSSLNITNNPGAIINWQGFSIGQGESTRFIQQSASSSVLNRVIGPDPSLILGTLTSNGRVFLINPSGILFGQGARIDVAALVASTLNLSNQDFLAGRLNFTANPLAGKVENRGSITTPSGGSVYLVGSDVSNSGIINSPQGQVILAAGQSVKIFDTSTPGVSVELTAGDNNAVNLGEILAQSGQVGIYGAVLRNTGIINADQVMRDASGKIVLRAKRDVTLEAGSRLSANGEQGGTITVQSETGTTLASGTIEAKGTSALQAGGTVQVLGAKVGLVGGHINASGDTGGGTVLIGGDYQGKNPSIQNATATYMSADSTINADAISNGNGGKVVLWSNDSTRAYGSISARGGSQSGDGGLIETSGHWLDVAGISVTARAPYGRNGTWLLDPNNVTIQSAGSDSNVIGGPNFTSSNDNAILTDTTIQTTLNGGTSVVVTTGTAGTNGQLGDITVAAALTWTTANSLTLNAAHDVIVNFPVTATSAAGNSSIILNAGNDVRLNANGGLNTGMTASSINSAIRMTAVNDVIVNVPVTASALNAVISMSAGRDVTSTGAITASGSGAKIDMIAAGNGNVTVNTVTASGGGSMNLRANNNVVVNGALTADTATAPVVSPVTLIADNDGTGPGLTGGTVIFAGAGVSTAPSTAIRFNPAGYAATNAEVLAYKAKVSAILDAKAWVFGLGDNKIYDGTRTATVSGLKPDISAANPAVAGVLAPVTPLFDTKDVGVNKLVTFGSAFSDPVYDLFAPFGMAAGIYTARANITQAPLTVSATADSKIYNGNTLSTATPTVTTGTVFGSDTLPALTQVFNGQNVAGTTLVTPNSVTVSDGNSGANYQVTLASAIGSITAQPLSVTGLSSTDRIYNGTTVNALTGTAALVGLVGAESFVLNGASGLTGTLASKNAGSEAVTASLALGTESGGAIATNYALTQPTLSSVSIAQAPLTVTATTDSKTYNGNTASTVTPTVTAGQVFSGDTLPALTQVFNGQNVVGTSLVTPNSVTVSDGNSGANYQVTLATASGSITAQPLSVTGLSSTDRIYNGTTVDALTGTAALVGLVGSETFALNGATGLTGTLASKNAGSEAVTTSLALGAGSSGAIAGNYALTQPTLSSVTIVQAPLTVSATADSKTYNGNSLSTATPTVTTGTVFGSDTLPALTQVFNGQNVADTTLVTPNTVTVSDGNSGANYNVTQASATGSITAKTLTVTGLSSTDRTYDGTIVDALAGAAALVGLVDSETFALNGQTGLTGTLASKNAGTQGVSANLSLGAAANGAIAENYALTQPTLSSVTIAKANLAVTGLSASNKTYNANTTATLNGTAAVTAIGADNVTLGGAATGTFVDKNVGNSKAVTVNGVTLSGLGTDNGNYTLVQPTGLTADITPRPLTVSAVTDSRVYEGTTTSAGVPTSAGLQTGDTLNGPLTQAYASKSVLGTLGSTLVASGPYSVTDGNSGNNYTVTVNTAPGTITPLTLVGSITAANKVYDGDNTATILTRTLATPIAGDTVSYIGGTALFNDKNAAPGKTVAATGLSLAGGDAGNYTVNSTATTQANITSTSLGITASSTSKAYGTTMSFGGTEFSSTGLMNGDTVGRVSLTSAGAVATAGVAGSPYGITPGAATGGTFTPSNYTITYVNGALRVTPVSLKVTADAKSKVYGTTDPVLTFGVAGLVNNPAVGVVDTAVSALSGALTRVPGESELGNPYAITRGSLAANSNYTLGFTPSNLIIIGDAVEPTAGFNPGQFLYVGVTNSTYYYTSGNFWHISLNPDNADPGFDVIWGTTDLSSRVSRSMDRCESVTGGGFCGTWSFPQQLEKVDKK